MISLARNVAPTAGALAQAAGVGIAGAAMPASGGVIHGCYATGGPLRVRPRAPLGGDGTLRVIDLG